MSVLKYYTTPNTFINKYSRKLLSKLFFYTMNKNTQKKVKKN